MGTEIERKFLVDSQLLRLPDNGMVIRQGYIATSSLTTVRVRVKGDRGYITLKGPSTEDGLSRSEFEYGIPAADANDILDELCDGGLVEKVRYDIPYGGFLWEVDVFTGTNEGLILAEVELPDLSSSPDIPSWVDREVTGDKRYYNVNLAG